MEYKSFKAYALKTLNEVAKVSGDDRKAKAILNAVIANLYSAFPLFAPFLEENPWIAISSGTMATDGRMFYYNPEFVKEVYDKGNEEESGKGFMYIAFVMIHEVMHNTMGHFTRDAIAQDKYKWNVAADGEINYILNGMTSDNLYTARNSPETKGQAKGSEGIEFEIIPDAVLSKQWIEKFPRWKELAGLAAEDIFYKLNPEDMPKPPPPGEGGCPLKRDPCPYDSPVYRATDECKEIYRKASRGELTDIPCPKGGICPIPPDLEDSDDPPPPGKPPVGPRVPQNKRDSSRCPFKEGLGPANPNASKTSQYDNKGRPICPYADPSYRAKPNVKDLYSQADKGELAQIPCPLDGGICPIKPKSTKTSFRLGEMALPPVPRGSQSSKGTPSSGSGGETSDNSSDSSDSNGDSGNTQGKPQQGSGKGVPQQGAGLGIPLPGRGSKGGKVSGKLPPVPGNPQSGGSGGAGGDDTWDDGSPENVEGESQGGKPTVVKGHGDPFKEKLSQAGEVLEPGDIKESDVLGEDSKELFNEFGGGKRLPKKELENIGKKLIGELGQRSKQFGTESRNDHLGAYLRRFLNPPVANWKALLKQFLESSLYKTREKYLKKRVYARSGDYMRREVEDDDAIVRLVVTLDTSGSVVGIENTLDLFVNEIVHAVTSYEVEETYIIYCDTEISVEKYTDRQMHKFKVNKAKFKQEIHDKIAGGGGTSFIQPFQYLKAKKIKPDAFIYFTDGEGLFPSPSLVTFPTMWVIIDDVDRSVKIPSGLGGRLDIISNGGKGRQVGKSQFGESFIHRLVKKIII